MSLKQNDIFYEQQREMLMEAVFENLKRDLDALDKTIKVLRKQECQWQRVEGEKAF